MENIQKLKDLLNELLSETKQNKIMYGKRYWENSKR